MVEARVRGALFNPNEKIVAQFPWGLGHATNNQVEFLSLWKGLETSFEINFYFILVFIDSMIIIC